MPKRNLKKIFLGVVLILISIFGLVTAFYFLEVKPELDSRDQAKAKKLVAHEQVISKRAKVIQEEEGINDPELIVKKKKPSQVDQSAQAKKKEPVEEESLSLKSLVEEAKTKYTEREQNEVEGSLWVDRNTDKFIISLGAINGLRPGDELAVYDDDKHLGHIVITTAFDVISFVSPVETTIDLTKKDYYRVLIK